MATYMKIPNTILCAVVLWALVESRHVSRMERSLTIEGKGSNLTEKLQQEEIHADGLQHFTFPQTSTQTTPSVSFREDPLIPEDGNVQSLKNDDSIRVLYDRKVTIDKESPNGDFPDEKNKTVKTKANDVIAFSYNQTGPSSNKRSEVLISHSLYDHSTSTVYDEEEKDEKEREDSYSQEHHPVVSFTEPLKDDLEWRNVETKKKEKGKKEILEVATVPTDHFKLEKPLKDNVIGGKLKEKNKDSISEALDEQRSTIRIRNSSSVSLSENDNNNTLGSLDIFKADSSIANNEESVGQSVNSVINSNGVNSDFSKRSRVKYSAAKRAHDIANDTEAENSSASENQLVEEAARNTVPIPLNIEPQTTPSIAADTTSSDKLKHLPAYQRPKPTDSTPTKIDIFGNLASPLPTALVKPSVAFKQQLASKLKGLDPAPTVPIIGSDDLADENLEKLSGKLPSKPSLKKKSKPDYYAQPSEMQIPPTATAWTLVSMKAAAEDLRSARKPATPLDNNFALPETTTKTTVQQTTIPPVTRVKSFVPWSTRLLKSTTSPKPATTPLTADKNGPEVSTVSVLEVSPLNEKENVIKFSSMLLENAPIASTTEEHTVIRSTQELDRNMTESSINLIQASLSDTMVRDQSSTKSHDIMTTEVSTTQSTIVTTASTPKEEITSKSSSVVTSDNQTAEKDNVIDSKRIHEGQVDTEDKIEVTFENKIKNLENTSKNTTVNNEISPSDSNDTASDKNTSYINENYNFVLTISSTTATPDTADSSKTKNTNEFGDSDPFSEIFNDGGDESKSLEEDEEDENSKQTTMIPGFDPFETTIMSDLDEEDDEKYEDELPISFDKPTENYTKTETLTQSNLTESTTDGTTIPTTTTIPNINDSFIEKTSPKIPHIPTEIPVKSDTSNSTTESVQSTSSELSIETSTRSTTTHLTTDLENNPPTPTAQMPETNTSGIYVTSFDIVSKENTTLVVTKTPTEGDINWYNVDAKPVNASVEETTNKTSSADTTLTAPMETTNEPETTTETSKQEITDLPGPGTTVSVIAVFTSTTTIKPVPTFHEEKEVEEEKEDVYEEVEMDRRACVVVFVPAWKFCHDPQQLRESIAAQFMTNDVSWEQVMLFSSKDQDCHLQDQTNEDQRLSVDVCFLDEHQVLSPSLKEEFVRTKDLRNSQNNLNMMNPTADGFDNVFAAIVLSVIAAICLVLLGILLIIVRKRQGRFNYGQRCTPVSLDDYSLDNISVYNSVRRKGHRASKRSYGNPAFDDPGAPTHSINFAGLANFSSDREALDEEFSQIPMITVKPDELPPGAESKNRYANVIPLPETRVILQTKEGADPLDEYINANYIKAPKSQEKLYIACQAPLQSTVEDFWRMVWQQQTKVILMLTALNENGVEKCADYLPQLEITDCHRLFGDFQVTLKKHEVREKYIISTLQLKNLETNLWREVTHLWYSNWPAQGVPEDGNALIAFLIEARSYARGGAGPTVAHCSPGTGRTGTVIAIDLCIRDFETIRTVDIPRTVYALRRDRAGSVQTKDQYAFIYQVLNLYATKLTGGGMDSI